MPSISISSLKDCLFCKKFRNDLPCAYFHYHFKVRMQLTNDLTMFPFSSRQFTLEFTVGLQMTIVTLENIMPTNFLLKVIAQ